MCGITGVFNRRSGEAVAPELLRSMTGILGHRGPDSSGYFAAGPVGLGHRRLGIIDLAGGNQPISNEEGSLWVICNGEIFNYPELREELREKGHRFHTQGDTEVIVHAWEEYGPGCLDRFNGQFAFALWDAHREELVLARDHIGICPCYYAETGAGALVFASEIKAILRHPGIKRAFSVDGMNQAFSLWVTVPPATMFENVRELAPGEYLVVSRQGMRRARWWRIPFPDAGNYEERPVESLAEELRERLSRAVRFRLRADVPVGAYVSGGLDSSIIATLIRRLHGNELHTFSVAFKEGAYDESIYQREMAGRLGTCHHLVSADYEAMSEAFAAVVWHGESPLIRTAPSPLYLLSRLVRDHDIRVVLTGEGADEFFGGYNIFKEDKIRRFWARHPHSGVGPKLLQGLYPYINRDERTARFWSLFFRKGLMETDDPFYSHRIRWNNTSHIKGLFTGELAARMNDEAVYEELRGYLDPAMSRWHPLCRAQYLESALFLPGYLLSSQGDRMLMGHSVEGRFPFLDRDVIEFAGTIPPWYKLRGLDEKYILKRAFAADLPASISARAKQPYRAPIHRCFCGGIETLAASMLSPSLLREYGYFDPASVAALVRKIEAAGEAGVSARDDMALVGVVSLQLLHHFFIKGWEYGSVFDRHLSM